MTLKEIYEYIEPLLPDDQMAAQEASLILHFSDGSVEVVKKEAGRGPSPPLDDGGEGTDS